jgi:hypothetical protein
MNPDATCSDADGSLHALYARVAEVGGDVFCGRFVADLTPENFCD